MKTLSKSILILAISLVVLASTNVNTFAGEECDPTGTCIIMPKYDMVR